MFPYSSNFVAGGFTPRTLVEHDAVLEQAGSSPPNSSVAVTVCPPNPSVFTVMLDVPWPLLIVPADTDQL
jgi:hypothetical protein